MFVLYLSKLEHMGYLGLMDMRLAAEREAWACGIILGSTQNIQKKLQAVET